MALLEDGKSCLEVRGTEERENEIQRSDYNKNEEYSATHKDAISDGDPLGKGTQSGGHTHWLPDCTKPTGLIDYSNFNTLEGGGEYDIKGREGIGGRERAINQSMYNAANPYGADLIKTDANIQAGQFFIGQTTKHL